MQCSKIQVASVDRNEDRGVANSHMFVLPASAIHVWTIKIHCEGRLDTLLEGLLDPEEERRANRFAFGGLRHAFVVAHGALRHLLSRYLDLCPTDVRISYDSYGKPALASRVRDIDFNLTHSGELAAIAIASGCEVGIDIEAIRPTPDLLSVGDSLFRLEEAAEIRSLPPNLRAQGFFHCWVRKEACIKATGVGLSTPLSSFSVAVQPNFTAGPVILGRGVSAHDQWRLHNLPLAPDYAGALVYSGCPRTIRVCRPFAMEELLRMHPVR
jgi:4'-phosphopantetheinyl transferase